MNKTSCLNRIVRAEDLFNSLTQEESIKMQKMQLKNEISRNLEEIIKGHELYQEIIEKLDISDAKFHNNEEDPYYTLSKILIPTHYCSGDITEFTLRKSKEFKTMDGYYLSALINKCNDNDFLIYLEKPISYLGWENTKNINIFGDVDEFLCAGMISGKVILNGNANDYAGEAMEEGELIINGNARDNIGRMLKGGKIIINGNCGNSLGADMQNGIIRVKENAGYSVGYFRPDLFPHDKCGEGIIYLEGDYKSIGDYVKCKEIWHKGKLIATAKGFKK